MALRDYERPLETVPFYKYLGRLLTVTYSNCPGFISKLCKVRKIYYRLARIFGQEGSDTRVLGCCGRPIFSDVRIVDAGCDTLYQAYVGELPP